MERALLIQSLVNVLPIQDNLLEQTCPCKKANIRRHLNNQKSRSPY